ncbi:MAG: hypothetical protein GEU91_14005 [Rhizobiales bacterium]|nr:hypothetical protein [Hyphomicrobiales bacterium]
MQERYTQGDLFTADVYPVRVRTARVTPVDLTLRIKSAMGEALKACPDSAAVVAARISELTGREITADALYAYTAPSKPEHEIGIVRFVAFVRATGAAWLYDLLVEDEGLIVMEGREAHLAQLGLMQQQRDRLDDGIRFLKGELKRRPVQVTARNRPGGR